MNALPLPLWAEIVVAVLLVVGAAFALVGSWGLAKLGDFFKRLHGPSKATTLGVGCVHHRAGLGAPAGQGCAEAGARAAAAAASGSRPARPGGRPAARVTLY